jgi:glycosyltransferase involved in cell wall biosynthesis
VTRGLDLHLTILGDGRHRAELEQLARELGLAARVRFAGVLPGGEPVRAVLDSSDLFVLPSRAEAQGRALLEAMARGLPCISSAVGGVPELLPLEDLVPPGNVGALTAKIGEVLASRERLEQMAARNPQTRATSTPTCCGPRPPPVLEAVRPHAGMATASGLHPGSTP